MDNKESILDALDEFSRKPADAIPPILEQYLQRIARTGETIFPWMKLQPVFIAKMDQSMKKFHEQVPTDHLPNCPNVENVKFEEMRTRLIAAVNQFTGAPFTIQRLCELVVNPEKHYKRTDKFLRGIEKNILVVSTVDSEGRKVVSESKVLLNGLDSNGVSEGSTPEKLKPFTMPPPPNNSPATTNWSFSSTASSPAESEWRPQPMESSSEVVSASPTELWEKTPDSVKIESPSSVSQSYSPMDIAGPVQCLKPSGDNHSPNKQVSSSDDLVNVATSNSLQPAVDPESNEGTEPKVETFSPLSAEANESSSAVNAGSSEEGEPVRKKIKTDTNETAEADSGEQQTEQAIEERRQSDGFDTPVSSSAEAETTDVAHSTSHPQGTDTQCARESSSEAPSSSHVSESSNLEQVASSESTPSRELASSVDSQSSDNTASTSTDKDSVVSSMKPDLPETQNVDSSKDQSPDNGVTSNSEQSDVTSISGETSSSQAVSSSDNIKVGDDQAAVSKETVSKESESKEEISDSSTSEVSGGAQVDSAEDHPESTVSQSSPPEPMDTA